MSKKDYELIASTIRKTLEGTSPNQYATWVHVDDYKASAVVQTLIVNLADALESTNPRFDRKRFLAAASI